MRDLVKEIGREIYHPCENVSNHFEGKARTMLKVFACSWKDLLASVSSLEITVQVRE